MFSRHQEPEIRYESSGTSFFALLGAVGAGAALMYFLDPENGKRRRARVRDQVVHYKAVVQDGAQGTIHDATNRTRGAIARVQARLASSDEAVDDSVLIERVRAAMGHVIPDPLAIEVRAHDGCVTLKGPAQPDQIAELVACAERVRGVREVDNRLSVSNPS
jgi:osmotically-inducible protein OsmY